LSEKTKNLEILESFTSIKNDICNSIGDLSKSLEAAITHTDNNSFSNFFFTLIVAIVGAFSAYLFNFFHWKMVEKKKIESQVIQYAESLIKNLEIMAVNYWVENYKEQNEHEINAIEIMIKSTLHSLNQHISNFDFIKNNCGQNSNKQILKDFHSEIYDLITGDDFESKNRKSSKSKAMKISLLCTDVRAKISSLDGRI